MTKMNVSLIETDDYGENPAFAKNKNKAKTNPIQSQFWLAPRLALGVDRGRNDHG